MSKASDLIKEMFGNGFVERFAEHVREQFSQSWGQQVREERRRRLEFVRRMILELEEVRKQTIFSNRWAEAAIEAVITGDLVELKMWGIDGMSEEDFVKNSGENGKKYAEIYAKFREICEEALITAKPRERV